MSGTTIAYRARVRLLMPSLPLLVLCACDPTLAAQSRTSTLRVTGTVRTPDGGKPVNMPVFVGYQNHSDDSPVRTDEHGTFQVVVAERATMHYDGPHFDQAFELRADGEPVLKQELRTSSAQDFALPIMRLPAPLAVESTDRTRVIRLPAGHVGARTCFSSRLCADVGIDGGVAVLSRLALEDFVMPIFTATESSSSFIDGGSVTQERISRLTLPAGALRAASRQATCRFNGEPVWPCQPTDGNIQVYQLPAGVFEIELTLPTARALTTALLRDLYAEPVPTGSPLDLIIEGTSDGATWAELWRGVPPKHFFDPLAELPLAPMGAVQKVRLRGAPPNAAKFIEASELSFF